MIAASDVSPKVAFPTGASLKIVDTGHHDLRLEGHWRGDQKQAAMIYSGLQRSATLPPTRLGL